MSERFTRLFALPEEQYAEGSPLLIEAGALLLDNQNGRLIAQLKLKNLGEMVVQAVKIRLWLQDPAGRPLGEPLVYNYLDQSAGRGDSFGAKNPIPVTESSTRIFRAELLEVIFADGSLWTAPEGAVWTSLPAGETLESALGDPELCKQLQLERGADCRFVPTRHGDLWRCACGEVERGEPCPACGKGFFEIDLAALTAAKDERLAAEKIAAEKAAKEQKKKKKKRIWGIIIAATALVLLFVGYLAASPFIARSLAVSGKSETARKLLIIPAVADLLEPKLNPYLEADALLSQGNYDEAMERFAALGDYQDAAERGNQAEYLLAEELAKTGDYQEAERHFKALGDYEDAAERFLQTRYDHAMALWKQKEYSLAISILSELKKIDYQDSAEQWLACELEQIDSFIEQGSYQKAYAQLGSATFDSATRERTRKAISSAAYAQAESYYSKGKYKDAGNLFYLIKQRDRNYGDTEKYLTLCTMWIYSQHEIEWDSGKETSLDWEDWFNDPTEYDWDEAKQESHRNEEKTRENLIALLDFKDCKSAIVASDKYAFPFLLGNWSGGGYYFNITARQGGGHHAYYSAPYGNLLNGVDYIGFMNGNFVGYKDGHLNQGNKVYKITIVDENTINLYCYTNSKTYTMTRR